MESTPKYTHEQIMQRYGFAGLRVAQWEHGTYTSAPAKKAYTVHPDALRKAAPPVYRYVIPASPRVPEATDDEDSELDVEPQALAVEGNSDLPDHDLELTVPPQIDVLEGILKMTNAQEAPLQIVDDAGVTTVSDVSKDAKPKRKSKPSVWSAWSKPGSRSRKTTKSTAKTNLESPVPTDGPVTSSAPSDNDDGATDKIEVIAIADPAMIAGPTSTVQEHVDIDSILKGIVDIEIATVKTPLISELAGQIGDNISSDVHESVVPTSEGTLPPDIRIIDMESEASPSADDPQVVVVDTFAAPNSERSPSADVADLAAEQNVPPDSDLALEEVLPASSAGEVVDVADLDRMTSSITIPDTDNVFEGIMGAQDGNIADAAVHGSTGLTVEDLDQLLASITPFHVQDAPDSPRADSIVASSVSEDKHVSFAPGTPDGKERKRKKKGKEPSKKRRPSVTKSDASTPKEVVAAEQNVPFVITEGLDSVAAAVVTEDSIVLLADDKDPNKPANTTSKKANTAKAKQNVKSAGLFAAGGLLAFGSKPKSKGGKDNKKKSNKAKSQKADVGASIGLGIDVVPSEKIETDISEQSTIAVADVDPIGLCEKVLTNSDNTIGMTPIQEAVASSNDASNEVDETLADILSECVSHEETDVPSNKGHISDVTKEDLETPNEPAVDTCGSSIAIPTEREDDTEENKDIEVLLQHKRPDDVISQGDLLEEGPREAEDQAHNLGPIPAVIIDVAETTPSQSGASSLETSGKIKTASSVEHEDLAVDGTTWRLAAAEVDEEDPGLVPLPSSDFTCMDALPDGESAQAFGYAEMPGIVSLDSDHPAIIHNGLDVLDMAIEHSSFMESSNGGSELERDLQAGSHIEVDESEVKVLNVSPHDEADLERPAAQVDVLQADEAMLAHLAGSVDMGESDLALTDDFDFASAGMTQTVDELLHSDTNEDVVKIYDEQTGSTVHSVIDSNPIDPSDATDTYETIDTGDLPADLHPATMDAIAGSTRPTDIADADDAVQAQHAVMNEANVNMHEDEAHDAETGRRDSNPQKDPPLLGQTTLESATHSVTALPEDEVIADDETMLHDQVSREDGTVSNEMSTSLIDNEPTFGGLSAAAVIVSHKATLEESDAAEPAKNLMLESAINEATPINADIELSPTDKGDHSSATGTPAFATSRRPSRRERSEHQRGALPPSDKYSIEDDYKKHRSYNEGRLSVLDDTEEEDRKIRREARRAARKVLEAEQAVRVAREAANAAAQREAEARRRRRERRSSELGTSLVDRPRVEFGVPLPASSVAGSSTSKLQRRSSIRSDQTRRDDGGQSVSGGRTRRRDGYDSRRSDESKRIRQPETSSSSRDRRRYEGSIASRDDRPRDIELDASRRRRSTRATDDQSRRRRTSEKSEARPVTDSKGSGLMGALFRR